MRLGIPGGMYYYKYEPFIKAFFNELNVSAQFSVKSNKNIFNAGAADCVDEACFPVKLFNGHVAKLSERCDAVVVPRLMNTEFGESICPKFCGLPELVGRAGCSKNKIDAMKPQGNLAYTRPLFLNKPEALENTLAIETVHLGFSHDQFDKAFFTGLDAQKYTQRGVNDIGYKYKVFLAGHPYNIHDSYSNLNLIDKLHAMDIGVITEEFVCRGDKEAELGNLLKMPYWASFIDIFATGKALIKQRAIDGIIALSSFSCGTDAFTLEMLKNHIGTFPFLVMKLDEQTGEAGFDTRLEAFESVLSGQGRMRA